MTLSKETKDFARSLLAYEAAAGQGSGQGEPAVVRVCEKLHEPLCALAVVAGYRSLLARALTLARKEAPSLGAAQVTASGHFQGFVDAAQDEPRHASEGDILFIARLLGLLLALLGTAVTIQLVQDVFPRLTVTTEAGEVTPYEDILEEVGHLHSVSDRLQALADENPSVEGALMTVSGNLRSTATALELLAILRSKASEPEPEEKAPKPRREPYLM